MNAPSLPPEFDRKLLAAQPVDHALRAQYERQVLAMLEQTLTRPRKFSYVVSIICAATMAIVFAAMALRSTTLPIEARAGFGIGIIFAVAWIAISLRVLRRGRFNQRSDWRAYAGIIWAFSLFMVILFLHVAGQMREPIRGVMLILQGVVFLIGGAMFLVQFWINEARLTLEERMLETQLRIAELAEAVKKENRA